MNDPAPPLPRAILFDMDGTLTEPMLDFPRIKSEMGIGTRPILEALAEMSADSRAQAQAILLHHEDHAAANSTLNPGCRELLSYLHETSTPAALITRNSRRSVEIVLERHGLRFDAIVAREDGPFKPSPVPLQLACRKLAILEPKAWMVGDGQYDIEAACAAGIPSVWITHGRIRHFEATPWRQVLDLRELLNLLKSAAAPSQLGASNPPPDRASA